MNTFFPCRFHKIEIVILFLNILLSMQFNIIVEDVGNVAKMVHHLTGKIFKTLPTSIFLHIVSYICIILKNMLRTTRIK